MGRCLHCHPTVEQYFGRAVLRVLKDLAWVRRLIGWQAMGREMIHANNAQHIVIDLEQYVIKPGVSVRLNHLSRNLRVE